jgi:monovalent cation:H+ antiporter-2, CPA2 family
MAESSVVSHADDSRSPSVTVVFADRMAAGLALADQILLLSGLSQERAASIVSEIRVELNPELRGRVGV